MPSPLIAASVNQTNGLVRRLLAMQRIREVDRQRLHDAVDQIPAFAIEVDESRAVSR